MEKSGDDLLLEVRNISKQFGGTRALVDAALQVKGGEIVALLGENGAGKSTLIKILAGVHTADSGAIIYRGKTVTGAAVRDLPIAFIHQDLGLIDWMTVTENICLTLGYPRKYGLVDWAAARDEAARVLKIIGANINPEHRIRNLSRTEKSLVTIARALAAKAEIIVLDEPTASLPANEVAQLFAALRRLATRGVGMIYVSHRLDEVFEIADRTVILRDGHIVGEKIVADTSAEEVILMIVGRALSQVSRRPKCDAERTRLVLQEFGAADVGPINCGVAAGEIVALVGLRGAGQEFVGRALFGLERITRGSAMLDGQPLRPISPEQAMQVGVCLIGADRVSDSIFPKLSVAENMFLNPLAAGLHRFSYLAPSDESRRSVDLGIRVGLRPNNPKMPIELLSGGNQQKVVIGRWLHLKGKVFIFEDPTAGVDVGAKIDIYRLFDEALEMGAAILIASTDFEEVAKICHRALVFDRGKVVAEIEAEDLTAERLLAAASVSVGQVEEALRRLVPEGGAHAVA